MKLNTRTGNLTPKSNDTVKAMRFTGNFGQPDGFGSILTVRINKKGDAILTLHYISEGKEGLWSVMLNQEQRFALSRLLSPATYEAIHFEEFQDSV